MNVNRSYNVVNPYLRKSLPVPSSMAVNKAGPILQATQDTLASDIYPALDTPTSFGDGLRPASADSQYYRLNRALANVAAENAARQFAKPRN